MALVTIKLSPTEFDLIREAVSDALANAQYVIDDRSTDVKLRAEARSRAMKLVDLKKSLNERD